MLVTDPSLSLKLTGTNITTLDTNITWSLDKKQETLFTLQATSTAQSIPLTIPSNLKVLTAVSAGSFVLHFTTSVGTFDIPVYKVFTLATTQAFLASLTSFTVTTTSTDLIDIAISMYGETSS